MKMLYRIERLESRAPRQRKRIILVWVDREGKQTVVADTDPHMSSFPAYEKPPPLFGKQNMLRRRIEKVERNRPLAPVDLVERGYENLTDRNQ